MSLHSSLIRLKAARAEYDTAQQCCPHWDMAGDTGDHQCCDDLYKAQRELHNAREAVRSARMGPCNNDHHFKPHRPGETCPDCGQP